jgi:CubicO group peptidase (beta-lactamase class C family)
MSDHSTPLGGTCSGRFDSLRELFAAKLESGEDLGASLAVNIDGEMVVDLWGGWADEARTAPWTENTIANVFSTTKAMTSLAALVLVDRGELDLDATVAKCQSNGIDLVIGIPFKSGVGYSLLPEGRVCCWGGTGGSLVIIDVDRRITFAYVMNKMAPGGGAPIAAALGERVKDIVTR